MPSEDTIIVDLREEYPDYEGLDDVISVVSTIPSLGLAEGVVRAGFDCGFGSDDMRYIRRDMELLQERDRLRDILRFISHGEEPIRVRSWGDRLEHILGDMQ